MNLRDSALLKLAEYKRDIDDDIAAYASYLQSMVGSQYGSVVAEVETKVFLDVLSRGGKRIRGALVMAGYEMCGGTNRAMIVQAARAIEMLHAYILMIDDIQDRSSLRRGKPSAHKMVEAYHKKHNLKGEAPHAGVSLALNAAIAGAHGAQMILANLDAEPEFRIKALSITNRTMAITAHGQTLDIMNELIDEPSEEDIQRVLEWKTALYTVINPLHVGMVLAGAECEATTAITPYALHAGKAFQITDDILGVFGDEKELGKTPGDDIREGKGTVLVLHAIKHSSAEGKKFLKRCLGNPNLTAEDFNDCQRIIKDSGALDYTQKIAADELNKALKSLEQTKGLWSQDGTDFLKGLAQALQSRVS